MTERAEQFGNGCPSADVKRGYLMISVSFLRLQPYTTIYRTTCGEVTHKGIIYTIAFSFIGGKDWRNNLPHCVHRSKAKDHGIWSNHKLS